MQLHVTQSEVNLAKQIGVFVVFMAALILSSYYAGDLFRFVMMAAGGWHVGGLVEGWCRKRWPC
jgi:hypothetical protein